jgi:cytochrome c2
MTSLALYAKLLGLLAALTFIAGLNFAVWGRHRHPTAPALYVPGSSAERGRILIGEKGCGACHVVPGVRGAVGKVGPRLDQVRGQVYVAGSLPNNPRNLTSWISNPKQVDPRTAMPDLGISDEDARDIAAYLYSLPPGRRSQ